MSGIYSLKIGFQSTEQQNHIQTFLPEDVKLANLCERRVADCIKSAAFEKFELCDSKSGQIAQVLTLQFRMYTAFAASPDTMLRM